MDASEFVVVAADKIAEIADDVATTLDERETAKMADTDTAPTRRDTTAAKLAKDRPDLFGADGKPRRDFTERADAQTVADAIGGTVIHSGVAFTVVDGD